MARLKIARFLYALALLAMPLSYGLKDLLALVDITWVDPTLLLSLGAFVALGMPMEEKWTRVLVFVAFFSATIGMYFMRPSGDRSSNAAYVCYVEPIRLTLNVLWFWTSVNLIKRDWNFVSRYLALCVFWEFAVAVYLYGALYNLIPVPDVVHSYLELYKVRQAIEFSNAAIFRMAGTFIESPPFGLFMFSCLVIIVFALKVQWRTMDRGKKSYLGAAAICAFIGSVLSFSDQVLIALTILGCAFALTGRRWRYRYSLAFGGAVLLVAVLSYVSMAEVNRWGAISGSTGNPTGMNTGERLFHIRYSLGLMSDQPMALVTGIGPGRYGDYAVRTGFFPSTVTIQCTAIEWLTEYGVVGLCLIAAWVWRVKKRAVLVYGFLGAAAVVAMLIANMFQANWLWESWFLAFAFLYSMGGLVPANSQPKFAE